MDLLLEFKDWCQCGFYFSLVVPQFKLDDLLLCEEKEQLTEKLLSHWKSYKLLKTDTKNECKNFLDKIKKKTKS